MTVEALAKGLLRSQQLRGQKHQLWVQPQEDGRVAAFALLRPKHAQGWVSVGVVKLPPDPTAEDEEQLAEQIRLAVAYAAPAASRGA